MVPQPSFFVASRARGAAEAVRAAAARLDDRQRAELASALESLDRALQRLCP